MFKIQSSVLAMPECCSKKLSFLQFMTWVYKVCLFSYLTAVPCHLFILKYELFVSSNKSLIRLEGAYTYSISAEMLPKKKKKKTDIIISSYKKESCNIGDHILLCAGKALLKNCIQFCMLHEKKYLAIWFGQQRRGIKMICGSENTTCEGRLKDLWLFGLEKKRLWLEGRQRKKSVNIWEISTRRNEINYSLLFHWG